MLLSIALILMVGMFMGQLYQTLKDVLEKEC